MSNFEFMQETVDAICKSMEEEPYEWNINTYTVWKKGTKIEYWKDGFNTTWDGSHQNVVFSEQQAKQIKRSFEVLKQKLASDAQKQVINSFKPKVTKLKVDNVKPKPWWKFW